MNVGVLREVAARVGWKKASVVIALCAVLTAAVLPGGAPAPRAEDTADVQALMRKIDELWRGESSHARWTMMVKTRRYQRTMTMEAWSEGKDKSLVKVLSPKKDRGVATLKVERNIWNYLPKINRVTKIPPSMMMGSWMGSHFTNDDMVRESSFEEDYQSSITFSGERDGRRIYEVTSLPRPDAPVVWGKVVTVIDQDSLLPLRGIYYDEDGVRARLLLFEDRKRMGGRLMPTRMVLKPDDKPGESTVIVYEDIDFDVKLPAGFFSLRSLRRR